MIWGIIPYYIMNCISVSYNIMIFYATVYIVILYQLYTVISNVSSWHIILSYYLCFFLNVHCMGWSFSDSVKFLLQSPGAQNVSQTRRFRSCGGDVVDGKQQNFPSSSGVYLRCLEYMSCLGCGRPLYPLFSPQACYHIFLKTWSHKQTWWKCRSAHWHPTMPWWFLKPSRWSSDRSLLSSPVSSRTWHAFHTQHLGRRLQQQCNMRSTQRTSQTSGQKQPRSTPSAKVEGRRWTASGFRVGFDITKFEETKWASWKKGTNGWLVYNIGDDILPSLI